MRIVLDEEEASSLLALVLSQVLDQVELSDAARATMKEWRYDRKEGTEAMLQLAKALNVALGNVMDEETTRVIRRRDYFRRG